MSFAESCEHLRAVFEAMAEGLVPDMVRRPSNPPTLHFVDDPQSKKLAELVPAPQNGCTIQIHRRLLEQLDQMVRADAVALNSACLRDVPETEHPAVTEGTLVECVIELAETFALLHECCHYLCGHLDAIVAQNGAALAMDEGELHFGADSSGASTNKALGAYYLELEADNTALQLMMLKMDFGSLRALFASIDGLALEPEDSATIFELNELHRVVGFRVLLAAIWIVIQLFENRKTAARAIQKYHPLPSARLLASVFQTLSQFAELTSEERDESGVIVQTLETDEQVSDLKALFRLVIGPVLTGGWRIADDATAHEGFRTAPVWLAQEIGLLFLGHPPKAEAGIELIAVQGLRESMTRRLGPFRYLSARITRVTIRYPSPTNY
jgi:hypothetical protein